MPDANTLTVGVFAVIAQHEREMISKRTIDALTAKKARGAVLGTPANMTPAAIGKCSYESAEPASSPTCGAIACAGI
jgi:DNA invertase Pin-like site-specific DNA recombinase